MLELTTPEIMTWIGAFMWPFMRIGAMMFAAPFFGSVQIPRRLRLLFALGLTVAVMPAVGSVPSLEPLSAQAMAIAAEQVLVGLAMGALLAFAFHTVVIGGESVALSSGLGFASMVDPQTGVNIPVVSRFLQLVATLLFLAVGGHRMFIELMAASFTALPIDGGTLTRQSMFGVAAWGTQMYAGAVLIALPAVIMLLILNVLLGVMTRAAPQMNIFSVGFPVTILLGLVLLLFLVVPSLPLRLSDIWTEAFRAMTQLLTGS